MFAVQDELFSMETQNYPEWSGEKLVHDPSLTIFYDEIPDEGIISGESIPGYNVALIIGVISVFMVLSVSKYKKRSKSSL